MVTLDNVRAARLQQCNDLVGKPVLKNAVAQTQQFIDLPHNVQSTGQAVEIAMQIGDDPELHEGFLPSRLVANIVDGPVFAGVRYSTQP